MSPNDDVEQRFAAIARELDPTFDVDRTPWRGQAEDETGNVLEAMDRADEEEEIDYRPLPLPAMKPWASSVIAGALLLGTGFLVWILLAAQVTLPGYLVTLSSLGAILGLSILLWKALSRDGDPVDRDGGAVV